MTEMRAVCIYNDRFRIQTIKYKFTKFDGVRTQKNLVKFQNSKETNFGPIVH
jgi:hypothetical protein